MGVRIIIANHHQILRQGLRVLLEREPDMEVVAEAEDGLETVSLVREFTPHVVIVDVKLPSLNGIDASRQILSEYAEIKVIALSMHAERHFILNMLKAGAHGYLHTDCPFEELAQAIRLVMAHKTYLAPGVTEVVVNDYMQRIGPDQTGFSLLTTREREVLQLVVEGKSTKQVAKLMHLSVKTIETHRLHVMHKLGMNNVADLTKFALREGLTTLEL
jgi:DNA-binding NarL/FixJ family response regulator